MAFLQQGSVEDLKRLLASAEKEIAEVNTKVFDSTKEKTEEVNAAIGRKKVIELRLQKLSR